MACAMLPIGTAQGFCSLMKYLTSLIKLINIVFMKIMNKKILVNRNFEILKSDFDKVITDNYNDWYDGYKLFHGKITDNNFIIYGHGGKLDAPNFHGEFIKQNINETIMNIDIHASIFHIIINIVYIIIIADKFLRSIYSIWILHKNLFIVIFLFFLIFIMAIIDYGHYFYKLKMMLNDLYLFTDGNYSKYTKERPNGK